jgi:GntR family transcriptional regulator
MPGSTLYAKIEETIATEIAQGEYGPGDQLPTEDALLQRFQVSRITVRREIQNLDSRLAFRRSGSRQSQQRFSWCNQTA